MSDQPKLKLSIIRVALAGAISAAAFFTLCWLGALLPIGPASHMYLNLFTAEPGASIAALFQGICWSIAFGLIAGGLFALVYNALSWLERG
jgi:hypothetical protein